MTLMNILVENLNNEITENDLNQVFSEYGEIASVNLIEKNNGSGIIAIVVMTSRENAMKAISGLNRKSVKGCQLRLSEAPENLF